MMTDENPHILRMIALSILKMTTKAPIVVKVAAKMAMKTFRL